MTDAAPELNDLSTILDEQERKYGHYYPLKKDIFAAFNNTPLGSVKVIIFGQDPYHQTINVNGNPVPRAVGMSFSVRREDSIPSSLQNIYTELTNTVRGFSPPDHGDLREWARQGVLLLNTCLTVRPGQPDSHGDIWHGFIKKVIAAISAVNPYCIALLWGRNAQKLRDILGDRFIVLEAAHPSGFSARRGFFGCNHFNLVNEHLVRQGKVGINWKISSLAELRAPCITPPLVHTHTDHKPILAPVDVTLLPTIIPLKSTISHGLPTIIGVPDATGMYNQSTSPVSKLSPLPIIPNTKRDEVSSGYLLTKASPKQSTPPPDPNINQNSQQSSPVPAIPKITFGTNLTGPPPISIGNQQVNDLGLPKIISLTDQQPVAREQSAPITTLPVILPLVGVMKSQ
jgi:uracil-DNA glycosylase